jgi:acyl-CoA reductase-like NAD-dependent aldehyde dehydrogenase
MSSLVAVREYRNLVGGELVDAVEGGAREIINPADGEVIGRVPEGTQADVERALAAARAARFVEALDATLAEVA